jgi:ATP-dependent Clp protease ATP-binding subunit ClpC
MFERYTERARRAIFFARLEAGQHGSPTIDSCHILVGLLRVESELASAFIKSVNEQATIRDEIESQIPSGERIATTVAVPFSAESELILKHAERDAAELSHSQIGTGPIFLGILHEPASLAARILANHNLDAAVVRQAVASSPPS